MAGHRSATLVLGHTFSDQREVVSDLIARPVEMRVVRFAETTVPIAFADGRRETEVAVECEACGERVVAHVLSPDVFRAQRRTWLAAGLTIVAVQVFLLAMAIRDSLDLEVRPVWGVGFLVVLLTLPVGVLVASVGAGKLTDVPRRRRPRDKTHGFRVDGP